LAARWKAEREQALKKLIMGVDYGKELYFSDRENLNGNLGKPQT